MALSPGESSVLWINMATGRSSTGTRTLLRSVLSRHSLPVLVPTRTGPLRQLSSLPPPGTWTSELSRLPHRDLYRLSVTDPDRFWGAAAADRLHWMKPFEQVQDCDLSRGRISWFPGGQINVSGERAINQPNRSVSA